MGLDLFLGYMYYACGMVIANLQTVLMDSGTKRHPVQDSKWCNCLPCLRFKTLKTLRFNF